MAETATTPSRSERIRNLVESNPTTTFTVAQIAEAIGDDPKLVQYSTTDLVTRGFLARAGRGLLTAGSGKPQAKKPGRPRKTAAAAPAKAADVKPAPKATAKKNAKKSAKKTAAANSAPTKSAVSGIRVVGELSNGKTLLELDGILYAAEKLS